MGPRLEVQRPAALRELLRYDRAVLDRTIRSELQLRAHVGDGQPDPADARKTDTVRVLTGLYRRVPALRLEVRELPLEDRGDARGIVDDLGVARQLHRGVVRGRHAVLVLI